MSPIKLTKLIKLWKSRSVMADRRVFLNFRALSLVFSSYLLLSSVIVGEHYKVSNRYSYERLEETCISREPDKPLILLSSASRFPRRTNRRFLNCRIPYDVTGICSFQLQKLSGDIHPNPGPSRSVIKFPCGECHQSVRNNQDAILCAA